MAGSQGFFETIFHEKNDQFGCELYKLEEHQLISQKWRENFSTKLHSKTGNWSIGGYDWHVFSYDYTKSIKGVDAIASYEKVKNKSGYIFTHAGTKNPLCCSTPQIPAYTTIKQALSLFRELSDVYIVAKDFSWTFVVTHEDSSGIGPFFSSRS
jgi:hypothetical protein